MQLSHSYNWLFTPSPLIRISSAGASATAHFWLHVGESHHKAKLSDRVHFYCLQVILRLAKTVVSSHRLPLNAHPQPICSVQQYAKHGIFPKYNWLFTASPLSQFQSVLSTRKSSKHNENLPKVTASLHLSSVPVPTESCEPWSCLFFGHVYNHATNVDSSSWTCAISH